MRQRQRQRQRQDETKVETETERHTEIETEREKGKRERPSLRDTHGTQKREGHYFEGGQKARQEFPPFFSFDARVLMTQHNTAGTGLSLLCVFVCASSLSGVRLFFLLLLWRPYTLCAA